MSLWPSGSVFNAVMKNYFKAARDETEMWRQKYKEIKKITTIWVTTMYNYVFGGGLYIKVMSTAYIQCAYNTHVTLAISPMSTFPYSSYRSMMRLSLWTNSAVEMWQESKLSPFLATREMASPTHSTTSYSVARACSSHLSRPAPVRSECGLRMNPTLAWLPWILKACWELHPIRTRECGSC